ncbi:MAG TPA: AAA family ATPase [Solirubrobacterales bacterium]|nr:AAA family ATPase [Solirubrobacterales bacterium]
MTYQTITYLLLGLGLLAALAFNERVRWRLRRFFRNLRVPPAEGMAAPPVRPSSTAATSAEGWSRETKFPPELYDALLSNDCVLFAGPGLDVRGGLPDSTSLLGALLEGTVHMFPPDIASRMRSQLKAGELDLVSELIASRISGSEVAAILEDANLLTRRGRVSEAELMFRLSRLPFSGAVTNSWSDLLESMFREREPSLILSGEGASDVPSPALLRSGDFFIVHLAGAFSRPASLQLGWQQYRETLSENRELERFMASLHASKSFLFMGASFDAIEGFFDASSIYRGGGHRHFALVPWGQGSRLRAERLRDRYGVQLLRYKPDGEDGSLIRLVEELEMKTARGRLKRSSTIGQPPRAEGLTLENIGPFESLELDLHADTTVLLGNNAAGKSSILRAIALVLAGEGDEVDRAATDLLRSGQPSGFIELRLEGERYRTVLSRASKTRVRARAEQLSPVASGLWLGIGFPALRGVQLTPLSGPALEPSPDPSADDVNLLTANLVDDRLGSLHQWVLNTAVRAEGGPRARRASRRVLDTFFSIADDLTPGVDFKFAEVDHETWRVMVATEDGLIGLDQLSRGMTAMFSWVGVLMQRLFSIYGDDFQPDEARALILVDEVDLHLHPEWQRLVLPVLRRHFPHLQLIVSTHSPLVVGSDPDARLVHLQRTEQGITSSVLAEDFEGWRSDQILTGPAFHLSTTRAKLTEAKMEEYTNLLSRKELSPEECERVEVLAAELRRQLPRPQESEVGRKAADLVHEAIRQRLGELPLERRKQLATETEAYLREMKIGGGGK